MKKLKEYGRFIKVEHTIFSFPLILAGAFMGFGAGGEAMPSMSWVRLVLLILLAGFGARIAALGLNRIIDREIDRLNPRTRVRELPSGSISLTESMLVTGFGLVVYLVSAGLICDLVLYLSPIPLVVFVLYPYMKRFTPLCHFGVGAGLALAPIGGFVAATCSFNGMLPALLLGLFTFFWVSGFDIIYATLDEEFDRDYGLYSMVSRFGKRNALMVSGAVHALAFLSLLTLYLLEFRSLFSIVLLLVTGCLLYLEQRRSSDVDLAFFRINAVVGFAVFLFVLSGIYLH